jgi:carbamoyltransferase
MKIAGVWSGHDASFCILKDGYPEIHAEYERYIREKEPLGDSLQFMMDEYPDFESIKHVATCFPQTKLTKYENSLNKINSILKKNDGKIFLIGHHQAHAANTFFSSNFNESMIVTIDGGGVEDPQNTATACTLWYGKDNHIKHVKTFTMNEVNIGGLWTRATRYIFKLQSGWPRGHQAGTVMAMAALGDKDRFAEDFYKMLTKDLFLASMKPQTQPKGAYIPGKDPKHPYLDDWVKIADSDEQTKFDLAAGLQHATEALLFELIGFTIQTMPNVKNLCLAGGVSLNSVAVGKIKNWYNKEIENVYVTPVPHDGGLAVGAAQYAWHQILGNERIVWSDNFTPYLGEIYKTELITETLNKFNEKITFTNCEDDGVIDLLDNEKIVAVFGGGSESGRRALGNRSILADPRPPQMKDKINHKVKHRQWFRPFAPSILREEVANWFKEDIESPYMSFVLEFKDEVKDKVPAVVHVDGTARLQTISKNDNEWYYTFIKKWQNKTGVPILLNTSFNDREPICETPEHAINCFLKTEIDHLYFYNENILVSRK